MREYEHPASGHFSWVKRPSEGLLMAGSTHVGMSAQTDTQYARRLASDCFRHLL